MAVPTRSRENVAAANGTSAAKRARASALSWLVHIVDARARFFSTIARPHGHHLMSFDSLGEKRPG